MWNNLEHYASTNAYQSFIDILMAIKLFLTWKLLLIYNMCYEYVSYMFCIYVIVIRILYQVKTKCYWNANVKSNIHSN